MKGTVQFEVQNISFESSTLEKGTQFGIRIFAKSDKQNAVESSMKKEKKNQVYWNEQLQVPVQMKGNEELRLEVFTEGEESALFSVSFPLEHVAIPDKRMTRSFEFEEAHGKATLNMKTLWTPKEKKDKSAKNTSNGNGSKAASSNGDIAKPSKANSKDKVENPHYQLAMTETHRPWYLRASYYYGTTKKVYAYTTSFRVVSSFARMGENSMNYVLTKLSGHSLEDLDHAIVPTLDTVDDKLDEKISVVLEAVVQGQTYLLNKKNSATGAVSGVTHSAYDTISTKANTVITKTNDISHATLDKVYSLTSSTTEQIVHAKDTTISTISKASSSTYQTVRGATLTMVSYIPIVGKKVMA